MTDEGGYIADYVNDINSEYNSFGGLGKFVVQAEGDIDTVISLVQHLEWSMRLLFNIPRQYRFEQCINVSIIHFEAYNSVLCAK